MMSQQDKGNSKGPFTVSQQYNSHLKGPFMMSQQDKGNSKGPFMVSQQYNSHLKGPFMRYVRPHMMLQQNSGQSLSPVMASGRQFGRSLSSDTLLEQNNGHSTSPVALSERNNGLSLSPVKSKQYGRKSVMSQKFNGHSYVPSALHLTELNMEIAARMKRKTWHEVWNYFISSILTFSILCYSR